MSDDIFDQLLRQGRRRSLSKNYVHFDEIEDVLSSLDLVALVVPLVHKNPSYWKWMIVGAHNALQGAMVCALADTTGTAVLDKKSAKEMLTWLQTTRGERGSPPRERLADFSTLLARCMAARPNSQPLSLNSKELDDIRRLHREFRNSFAHFTPKGWSIEKEGLPRIICSALRAAKQLMLHDQVTYRMSGNKVRRLKRNLKATTDALSSNFS